MPSKHQTGAGTRSFDSEPKKMLATKNDATIKALVRGIRRKERARAYIQAELALADEEGRDPRKPLIGLLNSKVGELRDDASDGDAERADASD